MLFVWMVVFPDSLSAQTIASNLSTASQKPNGDYYGSDGSLLFHVESSISTRTIWNRNGQIMPNGRLGKAENSNSLNGQWIVPLPGNNNVYYLFTTDGADKNSSGGLRYNVIDMNAGGGLGDVVSSGCLLLSSTQAIAVIPHSNGVDQWILAHKTNADIFVEYCLTSAGIKQKAVVKVGKVAQFWTSELSPTLDGRKLVFANLNWTCLFDFDNSNGRLSNPVDLKMPSYSVIFSHSGRFIYLAHSYNRTIYQLDLLARDDNHKLVPIGTCGKNGVKSISRGSDGRIYLANWDRKASINLINDPEQKGDACDYHESHLILQGNLEKVPCKGEHREISGSTIMLTSK